MSRIQTAERTALRTTAPRRKSSSVALSQAVHANHTHVNSDLISKRDSRIPEVRGLTFWGQWLAALTVSILLLCVLALIKTGDIATHYRVMMLVVILGSVPAYSLVRAYHKQHGYLIGLGRLLAGWLILLSGLIVAAFITKTSELFS